MILLRGVPMKTWDGPVYPKSGDHRPRGPAGAPGTCTQRLRLTQALHLLCSRVGHVLDQLTLEEEPSRGGGAGGTGVERREDTKRRRISDTIPLSKQKDGASRDQRTRNTAKQGGGG